MAINAVAGGQFGALSGTITRSQASASAALGNCYRFSNGAVTVPASALTNPADSYSIELWARANTVTTTAVMASIGADTTPGSLKLNVYGPPLFVRGELRLSATQYARADWTCTDSELQQWHHYVFAVDRTAGYARLFIDGLLVQEQPWDGGAYPGLSAPLVIGQQALTGFNYPFYGDVDEIAIYRRALSAYEVRRHFCASGLGSSCESVRVPTDFATIQTAIDSAPATASRFIAVNPGTYAGPIDFKGKNVIGWGEGRTGLTTLSGTGGQSVPVVKFAGNEPSTSYIRGFTVRNGSTGGVIPTTTFYCGGGLLALNSAAGAMDCIFEQNTAPCGGGAYLYRSTSSIQRCTFSGNTAQFYGGGLQAFGGSPKVIDTLIQNNSTPGFGGGMHAVEGTPTLRRTVIRNNSATTRFGGVSWDPSVAGAFMTVDDCEISSNSSAGSVGGFGVGSAFLETRTSFALSDLCNNSPRPNVLGRYTDLGGNVICQCKGDLNFDGAVTGADLGLLLASWGPCSGAAVCTADLNEDDTVNGADLGLMLSAWGCSQ
jgi:hypothetical protein